MKKLILFGICILLLIGIASAATYEQSKGLDLKVPCINNNTFCSSSATCNITILNPDTTILIEGKAMDNKGTYYNYSLNTGQTSTLGEYTVTIACKDGSENGYTTFNYKITETGEEGGNYIIAVYIILILAWLLFIIGMYKVEYTFIALAGIIMLVFGVYTLINGLDNFDNTLTIAFGGIHILFGAYLMIRASWEQYKDAF